MPVTIKVSRHGSSSWDGSRFTQVQSPQRLLHATTSDESVGAHSQTKPLSIIQTSFNHDLKPTPCKAGSCSNASSASSPAALPISSRQSSSTTSSAPVFASKNGFVHACIEAYNNHHSLVLRPDDVWLAVLTQLSIYVNAHSDSLQDRFVDHGACRQQLHIEVELRGADHGALAIEMSRLLGASIRDPGWREWIVPRFSTTTTVDETVESIVMMGTFQKYFSYSWGTRCGIPSVTLLGEQADWIKLRDRVVASRTVDGEGPRLASLGPECAAWVSLLRPVLDGFVDSFRQPSSSDTMASDGTQAFWQAICDEHVPNGSGVATYGGWITAFCFWDEKGVCLHDLSKLNARSNRVPNSVISGSSTGGGGSGPKTKDGRHSIFRNPGTARLTRSQIPTGFVRCPLVLLDHGIELPPAELVAGSVALRVRRSQQRTEDDDREERRRAATASGRRGAGGGSGPGEGRFFGLDEVQPESGWFLYWV